MINIFQCCYNFFCIFISLMPFFNCVGISCASVLLWCHSCNCVNVIEWVHLVCYKLPLHLYFCDAFNKGHYFVKYLSDFWYYLQGFQYWYHQTSVISLILSLYASNLMIDIFQCCYKFFCIFISLMLFFLLSWYFLCIYTSLMHFLQLYECDSISTFHIVINCLCIFISVMLLTNVIIL